VSGTRRLAVGIDFDLVCPWCFIGMRQLVIARSQFTRKYPTVTVESAWHPIQLLPDVPDEGLPFAPFYERRLGSPEAVRRRKQQVAVAARSVALTLDMDGIERMPNTARAHRLLREVAGLALPALYETLLERLFAAYFQRGEDIGDDATLRTLAIEVGVPVDQLFPAAPDDASRAPGQVVGGVPHFMFNGQLSLTGAHDAATLLSAMCKAVEMPVAAQPA
jgi:predicted DsbA family dithiol-disulfide isomerase